MAFLNDTISGEMAHAVIRASCCNLNGMRRLCSVIAFVLLFCAFPLHAADTTEAGKVAAWVRELPPVDADASFFGVLGGISTNHLGPAPMAKVRTSGPAALYADTEQLAIAVNGMATRGEQYVAPLVSGGIRWVRDVQNLPWGFVEVQSGTYRFEIIDAIVKAAQAAGAEYVGTVMPYAGWDFIAGGVPLATDPMCTRLLDEDFFYLKFDQRMDRYRDEEAFLRYLAAAVERYDGDGIDDMPGLTTPIRYWQIHNEPEGDRCGLFRDDVAAFERLMRLSSNVVHLHCPQCQVLNGGAAAQLHRENEIPPPLGVNFWRDYAALGGAPWIDVIAVHYNEGKSADHGNVDDFEYQIRRARDLLGDTKPVWVTEFGVIIGDHGNFQGLSEADAAAWYVRMDAAGLAAGAVRFFPDAPGFLEMNGTTYLTFYVQKLIQAKLGGFTSAAKLAEGQYRFSVNGRDVYVLWNGVPAGLIGNVRVTDVYGNVTLRAASSLTPSEDAPVFVEGDMRRRAARH
jgi:hypothetical protein